MQKWSKHSNVEPAKSLFVVYVCVNGKSSGLCFCWATLELCSLSFYCFLSLSQNLSDFFFNGLLSNHQGKGWIISWLYQLIKGQIFLTQTLIKPGDVWASFGATLARQHESSSSSSSTALCSLVCSSGKLSWRILPAAPLRRSSGTRGSRTLIHEHVLNIWGRRTLTTLTGLSALPWGTAVASMSYLRRAPFRSAVPLHTNDTLQKVSHPELHGTVNHLELWMHR